MIILVNSKPVELAPGTTLAAWLAASEYAGRRCAVAVNETFVPQGARGDKQLRHGDRIDVVEAVEGG